MVDIKFNTDNTQGHYPTSFDVDNTELKKNEKIVATDLTDLYDVQITSPTDGQVLLYEQSIEKWVNGSPPDGGGSCNYLTSDLNLYSEGGNIPTGTPSEYIFDDLDAALSYLRDNCIVIPNDVTVYINMDGYSFVYSDNPISLNHPYGERIKIIGPETAYFSSNIYLLYDVQINYEKDSNNNIIEISISQENLVPALFLSDGNSVNLSNIQIVYDLFQQQSGTVQVYYNNGSYYDMSSNIYDPSTYIPIVINDFHPFSIYNNSNITLDNISILILNYSHDGYSYCFGLNVTNSNGIQYIFVRVVLNGVLINNNSVATITNSPYLNATIRNQSIATFDNGSINNNVMVDSKSLLYLTEGNVTCIEDSYSPYYFTGT